MEKETKRSHKRIGSPENPLRVQIKRLGTSSVIPTYAHPTDAGMDLYATSCHEEPETGAMVYGTGIAVAIPKGYVGLVYPRSSVVNTGMYMSNSVGVIDSGYRGEITCKFRAAHAAVTPHRLLDRIKYLFKGGDGRNIANSIDTNYMFSDKLMYHIGDRIAQLIIVPYPKIAFEEVKELPASDRGTGGYGSTGK